jgi:dephospho-CoA kinase
VSDYFEEYSAKVFKADKEARHRRAVATIAEPLLSGLMPGNHDFNRKQFRALAQYLFEGEPSLLAEAMRNEKFVIANMIFNCVDSDLGMMTISEFSRQNGKSQRTLHDRAAKANLPSKVTGRKRFFYIKDLLELLRD